MIDKLLRRMVEWPCWLLHRTWWIPIWNRSVLLSCPIIWLCNKSPRFEGWFWE